MPTSRVSIRACYILICFSLLACGIRSQEADSVFTQAFQDGFRGPRILRVGFWNVENLFDTFDDPEKQDDDFTPEGMYHHNTFRYYEKLEHLSKAIIALGGWEQLGFLGLCEVENERVIQDLIRETSLSKSTYKLVHVESDDVRGIDVACLYNPNKVEVLQVEAIPIPLGETARPTRPILRIHALVLNQVEVHFFINHWPSRYGGQLASEPKRIKAAQVLRRKCDSLYRVEPNANMVIMGDFNDSPKNQSISTVLHAKAPSDSLHKHALYNLATGFRANQGTHKYHGEWAFLDQFMVSSSLLTGSSGLSCLNQQHVFSPAFLLESDSKYLGEQPFRFYLGPKYRGGYSDHLPICLDLQLTP